ncbi:TetR family transcriptional regulator C-terminal domain-containing protein [Pelosinus sp. sgz500959]|uniref:TetR/AcrR family transcriptional regulator n=1 Tax=Pelosinus sp. sgz500959 TaxID=3242472 RepID=UPI00366D59B7
MARKKSVDLEKTKQTLLEVGLSLFEQKGFNATGIQEIATLATIPKGSFYNYFSSKEEFGVAVIRYYTDVHIERWTSVLNEATEKEDSYKALSTAFLALTEKYRCSEIKKGCLLGNLAAEISEASEECRMALQQSVGQYKGILAERLLIGQQAGKVRKDLPAQGLADLIWDCWQGSLLRMKIENSVEPVSHNLELLFHHILLPDRSKYCKDSF